MHRNTTSALAVALLFAVFSLSACATQDGPELPPDGSMNMDMSAFSSSSKADAAGSHKHHNNAALRVGALNTRIALALVVPRLLFAAALSQQPIFEDDRWVWSFDAKHLGKPVNATLTGRFENNGRSGSTLELEMKVTCTHCATPTDNFTWYTGTFELGKRKGHWQFFDPTIKQADQTFVRIDWEVTDATNKTLTFTNGRTDGHEDAGDVIAYKRAGDLIGVHVNDKSDALEYDAEANLADGTGWLKVPKYNGGQKSCWDNKKHDTTCE